MAAKERRAADPATASDGFGRHTGRIAVIAVVLWVATGIAIGGQFLAPPDMADDAVRNTLGFLGLTWNLVMLAPVAWLDRTDIGELWLPFVGALPWAVLIDVMLTLIGRAPSRRHAHWMTEDIDR